MLRDRESKDAHIKRNLESLICLDLVVGGGGDRVKLWTDHWCGESPLHLTFPDVYKIASNKEA